MDRNKRKGGGHASHGSSDQKSRQSVSPGWCQVTTKRGELLIEVLEDGSAAAYSMTDGSSVSSMSTADLLGLARKGAPCPNGSKLLYEIRSKHSVPA